MISPLFHSARVSSSHQSKNSSHVSLRGGLASGVAVRLGVSNAAMTLFYTRIVYAAHTLSNSVSHGFPTAASIVPAVKSIKAENTVLTFSSWRQMEAGVEL